MKCGTYAPHDCAATDCKVGIGRGLLMCPEHWRQVPPDIQRRVYDTLAAYKARAKRDLDGLDGAPERIAYYDARRDAIASVAPPPAAPPEDPFRCPCGPRLTAFLCGVTDMAAALRGAAEDATLLGCELRVEGDRATGFTCSTCLATRGAT